MIRKTAIIITSCITHSPRSTDPQNEKKLLTASLTGTGFHPQT
jgi:hypothetical protein